MTPKQKAKEIISNLSDRRLGIDDLDEDIQKEILQEIIDTINK